MIKQKTFTFEQAFTLPENNCSSPLSLSLTYALFPQYTLSIMVSHTKDIGTMLE